MKHYGFTGKLGWSKTTNGKYKYDNNTHPAKQLCKYYHYNNI